MTTAERLLREWTEWFDSGEPHYKAPAGMTRRFLAQVEDREHKRRTGAKSSGSSK